jgi:hypothetical protein
MFKHTQILCGLALGLTIGTLAHGADAEGRYFTHMAGMSCGRYLTFKSAVARGDFRDILKVYLTATNRVLPDTYSILGSTDIKGAMAWIDNFCKENPLKSYAAALENLIDEAYPSRTVSAPD